MTGHSQKKARLRRAKTKVKYLGGTESPVSHMVLMPFYLLLLYFCCFPPLLLFLMHISHFNTHLRSACKLLALIGIALYACVLSYICSLQNPADFFTKALSVHSHSVDIYRPWTRTRSLPFLPFLIHVFSQSFAFAFFPCTCIPKLKLTTCPKHYYYEHTSNKLTSNNILILYFHII